MRQPSLFRSMCELSLQVSEDDWYDDDDIMIMCVVCHTDLKPLLLLLLSCSLLLLLQLKQHMNTFVSNLLPIN